MTHGNNRRQRKEFLINLVCQPKTFSTTPSEANLISLACLHFDANNRYIKEILKDLLNTKVIFKLDKRIMSYEVFQKEMARRKL